MAAQLARRPSRVERQRIDGRVQRINDDRRSMSEVYKGINLKGVKVNNGDLNQFFKRASSIINENYTKRALPGLPYIALTFAAIKDALDYAQISGFALLLTIPLSIISSVALIWWAWGKTSFRAWKERLLRWLIVIIAIELIPFVSWLPGTIIFVFIIYSNETKVMKLINLTLDYLDKNGVLDRVI